MRVTVLGRTRTLLSCVTRLHEAGYEIPLIGTCQEALEYGVGPRDFEELAMKIGAEFFNDSQINSPNVIKLLKDSQADVAISLNWLTMIGSEAISAFPYGILNAHAGDLPRYRGNACPNWAILQGEKEIVLTIHFMDPEVLDGGPILLKRRFSLNNKTTIGCIYEWSNSTVPEMFLEAIRGLERGNIIPIPQPEDKSQLLRCYPRIVSDSHINWSNSAEMLARLIRASSEPFNGAYTYWNGKKLTIWRAYAADFQCPSLAVPGQVLWRLPDKGEVGIAAGEGVLVLCEVQLEGKQRGKASESLRSNRIRLGMMVEEEVAELKRRITILENIIREKHSEKNEQVRLK